MKPDGVRLATIIGLLESSSFDSIPVAVLDNKSNGLCYANPAFEKLCPNDVISNDFLEHVQRSPAGSASNMQSKSIVYNNVEVKLAWEEGVEGEPVTLLAPPSDATTTSPKSNAARLGETTTSKGVKGAQLVLHTYLLSPF
jgi:hypothetical protein